MTDTPSTPPSSDPQHTTAAAPGEKQAKISPPPQDLGRHDQVQWFGRPDEGEQPVGFGRLLLIILSGHVGVRTRAQRQEDFRRANGLHVFIAAIIYFVLIIGALIALTNYIANR